MLPKDARSLWFALSGNKSSINWSCSSATELAKEFRSVGASRNCGRSLLGAGSLAGVPSGVANREETLSGLAEGELRAVEAADRLLMSSVTLFFLETISRNACNGEKRQGYMIKRSYIREVELGNRKLRRHQLVPEHLLGGLELPHLTCNTQL
jgi:hypothetical protein